MEFPPLISICVTAYNASATIEAALRSALDQDWPNTEIVVYDDASTDDTMARLEKLRSKSPSIRLLRGIGNQGVGHARNELVRASQGEFIAFFDDDDTSRPDRLSKQYRRIVDYENTTGAELVICHCARRQIFPNGPEHYETTMGVENGSVPHSLRVAERILFGRVTPGVIGSCATCSQMARRRIYEESGGFDAALRRGEDTDLNIRLALAGGHFVGLAEPLVTQYMTAGSDKKVSDEYATGLSLLRKHEAFLRNAGWLSFNRSWIDVRFQFMQEHRFRGLLGLMRVGLFHPIKLIKRIGWSVPARRSRRKLSQWYASGLSTADPN